MLQLTYHSRYRLSAGRQVGLAAVISATLLQSMENMNRVFPDLGEIPIPVVILTVCAVGAVIGLVNGLVIAYLNVTPFIATMGTMIIVYGFTHFTMMAWVAHQLQASANHSLTSHKASSDSVHSIILHHYLCGDLCILSLGNVE